MIGYGVQRQFQIANDNDLKLLFPTKPADRAAGGSRQITKFRKQNHMPAWLGLRLDDAANAAGAARISMTDDAIEVRVMAADEEAMVAQHTLSLIRQ